MHSNSNDDQQNKEEKQPAPRKIGLFWSIANLVLRRVVSVTPKKITDTHYHGEQCPSIETVDRNHKTAEPTVKYHLDTVLMQPTPHTCADATAMMVLNFHRENLSRLLADPTYEISSQKEHILQETLKTLNTFSKEIKYAPSRLHTNQELGRLYCVMPLKITSPKKDPDHFAKELAFHLYDRGPLSISIKTHSFNVTHHDIFVFGILGNEIQYADCWNGKAKSMKVSALAKKFAEEDNEIMCIAVPGYSHCLLNSLPRVEPDKTLEQSRRSLMK